MSRASGADQLPFYVILAHLTFLLVKARDFAGSVGLFVVLLAVQEFMCININHCNLNVNYSFLVNNPLQHFFPCILTSTPQ